MVTKTLPGTGSGVVIIGSVRGQGLVSKGSPLRRLNYFDGKFLRAPDLILEQQALLNQVRISNQAGGAGVVHGYDCTLTGADNLALGAGFAIDPQGRVLLLQENLQLAIAELIEKSRSTTGARPVVAPAQAISAAADARFNDCVTYTAAANSLEAGEVTDLYLISLHHLEAYCGEEDVYGKLCAEACATSTARSYVLEGLEVRATPLHLSVLLKTSKAVPLSQQHLRSRVAAAYFEQERQLIAGHISAQGLGSSIWCLGAEAATGNGVPIALLGRRGDTTLFLDAWTARRERMDAPPRHYWAGRMMMRSWSLYLAQILQFQCQLRACLSSRDANAPCKKILEFDPCADTRKVAGKAAEGMRYLLDQMGQVAGQLAAFREGGAKISQPDFARNLSELERSYQQLIDSARVTVPDRLLINCGIVEVPSAGYLPVNPSSTLTVNEQVVRMFGPGVDLRFCVVRPDFVAHALEEAQHMERICLLAGIDDASKKPQVDVLVPNGEIQQLEALQRGTGYEAALSISSQAFAIGWPRGKAAATAGAANPAGVMTQLDTPAQGRASFAAVALGDLPGVRGAARSEGDDKGGQSFYCAALSSQTGAELQGGANVLAAAAGVPQSVLRLLGAEENRVAAGAVAAGTSSGLRINTNLSALAETSRSALFPGSALWLELKTERDPFSLNTGERCDLRAKLIMVVSRTLNGVQQAHIEERSLTGQLQILASAPQGADARFSARLIADGTWKESTLGGADPARTEQVQLDEKIVVSRTSIAGLPPSLNITVVNPSFFAGLGNVQLIFERTWAAAGESRVRALLRYQARQEVAETGFAARVEKAADDSRELVLMEGRFREDGSVLQAGNSLHSASLNALDQIGKAIRSTGFADQAGGLLFPPPVPQQQELRVLARESWVLFHRRRTKVCSQEAAPRVQAQARRYRVYHINLPAEMVTDEVTSALADNAAALIAKFRIQPVTTVEFAPALASVTNAHGDLRADWQAAVRVNADIHIAYIASEGEVLNEGETLAKARLQSLTQVLEPVSETAADLALLTALVVPPTLSATSVDGVVIYFTKSVATVCHSVFRLLTNNREAILERLLPYLQQGGESLFTFMQKLGGQPLSSSPRFAGDSDQFYGAGEAQQLAASWDLVGDGPISEIIALSAGESDTQIAVTRQQARRIGATLGAGAQVPLEHFPSVPNLYKNCPKATLLLALTECHHVYLFTAPNQSVPELKKYLEAFIPNSGLTAEMLNPGTTPTTHVPTQLFHPLRAVDFYRDSAQFEADSRQQFLLHWQSQLAGNPASAIQGFLVTIARSGATAADTAANLAGAKAQGEALHTLLGITSAAHSVLTNSPQVPFPVACRALTLIVVPRRVPTDNLTHVAVASAVSPAAGGSGLTLDLAENVRFDADNRVIRDAQFHAAVERLVAADTQVNHLEIVSAVASTDPAAEARAASLLQALQEKGVAKETAEVKLREASAAEKLEIVRSGFLLNRGVVLK